jgi:ribosome-associated protein
MTARNLALELIGLLQEKKGTDLLLLDLRRTSPLSDFFIVCTAQSPLHAQALADHLLFAMKHQGRPADHIEGHDSSQWILIDFFDVVVHIFLPDVRQFYGLERLWGDMPQRRFSENAKQ